MPTSASSARPSRSSPQETTPSPRSSSPASAACSMALPARTATPLTNIAAGRWSGRQPGPDPDSGPDPTPVQTPTPAPASAPPGSGTTTVNGTLDSGFLGLSVPASVTIPLVRNATNNVNVPVTIYANIIWNLQVSDPQRQPRPRRPHGFMVSGANVLGQPHARPGRAPSRIPCTRPSSTPHYDANLASATTRNTIDSAARTAPSSPRRWRSSSPRRTSRAPTGCRSCTPRSPASSAPFNQMEGGSTAALHLLVSMEGTRMRSKLVDWR